MRILAFIEEAAVIRKILDHLGLWDIPKRQPKQGRGPPVIVEAPLLVYADTQVIEYEDAYYIPEYLLSLITCGVAAGMVCAGNGENVVICGSGGVGCWRWCISGSRQVKTSPDSTRFPRKIP